MNVQFIAYLVVGGWNTCFGLGVYWLMYRTLGECVHYLILAIASNVIAITNAFLCYKLIVFRTRGKWLREYVKCWMVYGGGALASMALMWLMVDFAGLNPVLSNFIGTAIVVIASYFGHKFFSFRAT